MLLCGQVCYAPYLLEDIGKFRSPKRSRRPPECLQLRPGGITRIRPRYDAHGDAAPRLTATGYLRGVPRAQAGSPREREARQAFQDGALAGGLVAHDNELR